MSPDHHHPRRPGRSSALFLTAIAALVLGFAATGGATSSGLPVTVAQTGSGVQGAGLMNPFPIIQFTGTVTSGGTEVRHLAVDAPADVTATIMCRGRGCPLRSKSYSAPVGRGT